MEEVKVVFGIWLLAQIFIVPFILIDSDGFANAGWRIDFVALILMLILVAALKLMLCKGGRMKNFWDMPLWYKILALPLWLIITWILVHIVLRLFGYI